jgi:hypothetical protein
MLWTRSTTPFRATFDGQEIFDAFNELEPGWSEYAPLRAWEVELMLSLQRTEAEYSAIPVKERARMVAGLKLPQWLRSLEMHKQAEEARRKAGG